MEDYREAQDRREEWLAKRLTRPSVGQASEVELTIPAVGRIRIFRSPVVKGEWETYLHPERRREEVERLPASLRDNPLFLFEVYGTRENRSTTRRSALTWLAIHWDYAIDRAMALERLTRD